MPGFYLHPELPCTEVDGVQVHVIDNATHQLFMEKYGVPTENPYETIDKIKSRQWFRRIKDKIQKLYTDSKNK